ncbi:hypothetical protein ULMA_22320 [Patiriisocius marinus]|uniref:Uncharacterized protein n=1 Tax=Patiriisocius marinus TaxID=1397112 RepID=A0A5J4IYM3_9FLAO|nr:hypothetical protein ULMA_22320 [Patiriisocius marinus]
MSKEIKSLISWLTKSYNVGMFVVRIGIYFSEVNLLTLKTMIMVEIDRISNFLGSELIVIFKSIGWTFVLAEK